MTPAAFFLFAHSHAGLFSAEFRIFLYERVVVVRHFHANELKCHSWRFRLFIQLAHHCTRIGIMKIHFLSFPMLN